MSEASIFSAIADIITKRYGMEKKDIIPDLALKEELGFDSLDIMDFVMLLEDRFDVIVSDDCIRSIDTVRDLIHCVQKSMQKQSAE